MVGYGRRAGTTITITQQTSRVDRSTPRQLRVSSAADAKSLLSPMPLPQEEEEEEEVRLSQAEAQVLS